MQQFQVRKDDLSNSRLVQGALPELAEGEILTKVDRFALTANNVTYAAAGDMLGYWDFFPAASPWGRVPAMGWGEIVASEHPDVPAGGRYYGWFPMARSVDMTVSATPDGVRDDGAHRSKHAPVYRAYTETRHDPFYLAGEDAEDRSALLRGLFLTGFLADDFFASQDDLGARQALVLSASSKTAIGFAHCASARGLRTVGLTSKSNVAFVAGLGCYDEVLAYDEVDALAADVPSVVVDMAGNGAVLGRVHGHFGDVLRYSMGIGLSHHDAPPRPAELAGPQPEMFFAPSQVSKRVSDWGAGGYQRRVADALRQFVESSQKWLTLERSRGGAAAEATWQAVYKGEVPPDRGRIVSLHD